MTDLMPPKISVIMPVYNSESYLNTSINSILNQTYSNFELICINDCSNDASLNILNTYAASDSRMKVFSLKENLGCPGLVRNYGSQYASGVLIAFLDSDDAWEKTKLEIQMNAIYQVTTDLDTIFSFTKIKIFNGIKIYEPKYYLRLFKHHHSFNLLVDNTITTSTVIISKELFNRCDGFPKKKTIVSEDYELWIKATILSKHNIFCNEMLTTYLINPSSITNTISFNHIYKNVLKMIWSLLLFPNMKVKVFAILRFFTLPILYLYHRSIIARNFYRNLTSQKSKIKS